MTKTQTAAVVSLLESWMSGAVLADDLVPQTAAFLAQLATPTKRTPRASTDTASMSSSELFAHYKRTSYVLDIEFFLSHVAPTPAQQSAHAAIVALRDDLLTRAGKPADRLQYYRLRTAFYHVAVDPHTHTPCICQTPEPLGMPHYGAACLACGFTIYRTDLIEAVEAEAVTSTNLDAIVMESEAA